VLVDFGEGGEEGTSFGGRGLLESELAVLESSSSGDGNFFASPEGLDGFPGSVSGMRDLGEREMISQ